MAISIVIEASPVPRTHEVVAGFTDSALTPDYLDLYVTDRASAETHVYHIATGEETWTGTGYTVSVELFGETWLYTITSHTGWVSETELQIRGTATSQTPSDSSDVQVYTLIGDAPAYDSVETHTNTGLARMLDQFKGSPDLLALASSYLDQVQAFEDAAYPVMASRNIDVATGDRLDGLGEIVKLSRSGRDDDAYRLALKGELAVLQSQGTAEEMIALAQLLIQMGTADYEVIEYYPKGFYIRPVDHALTVDPSLIGAMLDRAISAATTMSFVYSFFDDAATFTLSSLGATTETSGLIGLGDAITGGGPYVYQGNVGTGGGFTDGFLRFDAVDPLDATLCRVQDIDGDAASQATFLDGLNSDIVHVLSDAGNGVIFTCSGTTDIGSYHELDISAIEMVGDPLTDLDDVTISATTTNGGHLSGVK